MAQPHRSRWSWLRFWVTIGVCAVIYSPSLFWTLGLDQNIFAEIASLMLRGKTLYVDAWDVKPPNVFYTYALFEWVFGQNEFAVRLSDYVFAMMACAAIYVGVERRIRMGIVAEKPRALAPLASLLFVLTLLSLGLADTAQTESYSLFFLIAAAILALERGKVSNVLAGAALAVAVFYKTTNAIFLLPIVIEVLLLRRKDGLKVLLRLLGGFLIWTLIQVGILAAQGSLRAYIEITRNIIGHHSQEVSQFIPTDLLRAIWIYADAWLLFAGVGIAWALMRRDSAFFRLIRLPLLFLVTGLLAVWIQNKGWGYHYVVILPGLIPVCLFGLTYTGEVISRRLSKWGVFALIWMAMMLANQFQLEKSLQRSLHHAGEGLLSLTDHPRYLASLGQPHSLYYPPATEALATYIKSHTNSGDRVFIFGEEPGAYWRSGRLPTTRFVYSLLFTSGVIPTEELRAMSDSLVKIRPRLFIIERFDTLTFRGRPETSQSLLETDTLFHPLHELIRTSYTVSDTVGDNFIIYRLKD